MDRSVLVKSTQLTARYATRQPSRGTVYTVEPRRGIHPWKDRTTCLLYRLPGWVDAAIRAKPSTELQDSSDYGWFAETRAASTALCHSGSLAPSDQGSSEPGGREAAQPRVGWPEWQLADGWQAAVEAKPQSHAGLHSRDRPDSAACPAR
jgi:hypothetical protein